MLSLIRKADYWNWREAGVTSVNPGSLSDIQDCFVLYHLQGVRGKKICEAGGGTSRVLPILCKSGNECWNIHRPEDFGGGPKSIPEHPDIRLVQRLIGDLSEDIPDNYFDCVFSISAIKHIPDARYKDFLLESFRILKPGGLFLNTIDLYLLDAGSEHPHRHELERRLRLYLMTSELSDGKLKWLDPPSITEKLSADASAAGNSIDVLYQWNRVAPQLRSLREQSVSCSLGMALIKVGG